MPNNTPQWAANLQQASWNGINFGVLSSEVPFTRKLVVNPYPNSDNVYLEDLGAGATYYRMSAYVVGNDVQQQAKDLIAALNTGQSGSLVHPLLGSVTCNVANFTYLDSVKQGNVASFNLEFVQNTQAVQSSSDVSDDDTQSDSYDSADDLDDASGSDFDDVVNAALDTAGTIYSTASYAIDSVQQTVGGFVDLVTSAAQDAVSIINSTQGIAFAFSDAFDFGVNANGNLTSPPAALKALPANLPLGARVTAATSLLVNASVASRAAIKAAGTMATSAISQGGSVPSAVQSLVGTLATGSSSADAVRLLVGLASYQANTYNQSSPIGMAVSSSVSASAAVCRRAALSALGRAVANYSFTSIADAQNIMSQVQPVYDSEIEYASTSGYTASASALKDLRSKVITDINARSSGLTNVYSLELTGSIPAARLAMRLYNDSTRTNEILQRNPQIIHPLFVFGSVEVTTT